MSKKSVGNALRRGSKIITAHGSRKGWSEEELGAALATFKSYFEGVKETATGEVLIEVRRRFGTACFFNGFEGLPGQRCRWYSTVLAQTQRYHSRGSKKDPKK